MARRRKNRRGLGLHREMCTGAEPTSLVRIRINSSGYDENGKYFGRGEPLFGYGNSQGYDHIRASSRAAAKAKLKAQCPILRFMR